MRLGGRLTALLDESPEYGIVKVIYVCCGADAQLRSAPTRMEIMGETYYQPVATKGNHGPHARLDTKQFDHRKTADSTVAYRENIGASGIHSTT